MPLKPGTYRIRYVAPGNVYAVTGEDKQPPQVQAVNQLPGPLADKYNWVLRAPDEKIKDQWTIGQWVESKVESKSEPDYLGWGRPSRKGVQTEDPNPFDFNPEIRAEKEAEREGILQWPDQPVLYTTITQNWQITETLDGKEDINKTSYNIKIPTEIDNVVSAVAVENGHLITKNYPVHVEHGLSHKLPAWQFIPI
ncbi:hypothetical protein EST38_g4606 [Candolleomyces aberdarensis]|uniref:Uncharacterized protein n=1 Tax=Candolleomyces aberdarensis TaxID=2316362 RepID=A0A4Q2DQU6_9AGAR|nr:hypothetical protein EST38_g4606 [Candolleomyces aberdarensis]